MKNNDKNNDKELPESLKVLGMPASSPEFESYYPELIQDNVRVEWDGSCPEGVRGEYNPDDPEDIHLLRFYIFRKEEDEWVACDDASYCTNFPADATHDQKMTALKIIMNEVYDTVHEGVSSIKKCCERLSWIGLDWLEEEGYADCPSCGAEYRMQDSHSCKETKECPYCGLSYDIDDAAGHSCMEGRSGLD